ALFKRIARERKVDRAGGWVHQAVGVDRACGGPPEGDVGSEKRNVIGEIARNRDRERSAEHERGQANAANGVRQLNRERALDRYERYEECIAEADDLRAPLIADRQ